MRRSSIAAAVLVPFLLLIGFAVAPLAANAGGGCHGPVSPPGDGESSVIKIDGCMYFPTVSRVPVGTTVRFLNTGEVFHNVTGVSGSWASDELQPGDEFRQTFTAPGVYPFACTLHPGMNGAIVVGDDTAAVAQPPAQLATSTEPAEQSTSGTDATTVAAVGVGALVVGLGLGVLGAGMRRRTTD
jgi:plastocyanin